MEFNATLITQALAFKILIAFTVKFIWPPLMNAIEERQKKIADGLAAADVDAGHWNSRMRSSRNDGNAQHSQERRDARRG